MALSQTITTPHGFVANMAYCRVENVKIHGKSSIEFVVKSYKSKEDLVSFDTSLFSCDYDLHGDNPFRQAYKHLKTLPNFAGAIDC
jgi:hypothetical protein